MPARNVKLVAATAIFANASFWTAVFAAAALRADGYSHLTSAVSWLGAAGAPNALLFNVFGFILPGVLVGWSGWAIGRAALPRGGVTPALLATFGVGLIVAGLFAADATRMSGWSTRMHMVGASLGIVAPVAWLAFGVLAWRRSRALAIWGLAGAAIFAATFMLYEAIPWRALVQRLTFAVAFGWYAVASLVLLFAGRTKAEAPVLTPP